MKIAVKVTVLIAVICLYVTSLVAGEKPTSLSDAQAAIDANLRTSEGKAFDEKMGNDFVAKHWGPLHACKQAAGGDFTSFWVLLKLDKDGTVQELLLYPTTKLGACARDGYLKDKFLPPPRPGYWVGVYLKLAH
jgi:hypothetical protein